MVIILLYVRHTTKFLTTSEKSFLSVLSLFPVPQALNLDLSADEMRK